MASSEYVFDVDEADFQAKVVERSKQVPVVVDFWAPWCGPCRALGPILERAVAARGGAVLLAKVNTDENANLAGYFEIQGIPAVKAIRDGAIVLQFEGVLPEDEIEEFLNRIVPSEADTQAAEAGRLEATDAARAEGLYHQVLATQPDHDAAKLGLARLRLKAGDLAETERLLDTVPPGPDVDTLRAEVALRRTPAGDEAELRRRLAADPENAQVRLDLGRALAAAGRYPEALDLLYSAAERDRELARGPVKETMVQVFHIIGVRSDLADEYRDKLRRVMY